MSDHIKGRGSSAEPLDREYMIGETEHFSEISYENCIQLAPLCTDSSDERKSWRVLAAKLGLSRAEIEAIANKEGVTFRSTEVLTAWMQLPGSTIWVLKNTLTDMRLPQACEKLEQFRYDFVKLFIRMKTCGGKCRLPDIQELANVPGRKRLVDVVRPLIHRKWGSQLMRSNCFVKMHTGADTEKVWTSPAKSFKGQQLDIEVEVKQKSTAARETDPPPRWSPRRGSDGPVVIDRNVISFIEEDSLMLFDYVRLESYRAETEDAVETAAASGFTEEEESESLLTVPVEETNPDQGKVVADAMDDLTLSSETSIYSAKTEARINGVS